MKAPEVGSLRVPEGVANVYRDMRDRRLLWVAGALIIAIIAVPFLLGGDPEPAPAPSSPMPADAEAGASQIDPVVLADVDGLRNFHKRLERFRSRNPFKQQVAPIRATTEGGEGGGNLPTADSATSSAAAPETSPADLGTSASSGSSPAPVPSETPPAGQTKPDEEPEVRLITYSLDVRIGPAGDTEVIRGVKNLALLPSRRKPIVQYVQSDIEGESASFIVSADATALTGDGKCSPNRSRCRYLLMKPGDEQRFRYEPEGRVYRLELLAIKRHAEPVDEGGGGERAIDASRWGFGATRGAGGSG